MRRWLILLFALLLMVGALFLYRDRGNWQYVVPVTPGAVAYASGFEDDGAAWELSQGRLAAAVAEGRLSLMVNEVNNSFFTRLQGLYWSDVDVQVEARPDAGPADSGYGLIVRFDNQGNTAPADDSYYLFVVVTDGYYRVVRSLAGEQRELSAFIPSPVIQAGIGATNRLRVVAQGDRFQFYINGERMLFCIPDSPTAVSTFTRDGVCVDGQLLDTLVDDTIGAGSVGVVAQTFIEPDAVISFDNFIITGPE